MNQLIKSAFFNSTLTTAYIACIALLMFLGGDAKIGVRYPMLMIITMLMLFVFSAGITGFLIVGKPAMLYVDGRKKDAITLLTYTFLNLGIYTFLLISFLIIISSNGFL